MSLFGWIIAALCAVILGLCAVVGIEQLRVTAANNRADRAELAVKEAQADAAALKVKLNAQAVADGARAQKDRDDKAAQFTAFAGRVGALGDGSCVAHADVERLLGDITRAANAAGVAVVDQSSADFVSKPAGAGSAQR